MGDAIEVKREQGATKGRYVAVVDGHEAEMTYTRSGESMIQADAAALLDRVHQPPSLPATIAGALLAFFRQPLRVTQVASTIVGDTWRTPGVLVRLV